MKLINILNEIKVGKNPNREEVKKQISNKMLDPRVDFETRSKVGDIISKILSKHKTLSLHFPAWFDQLPDSAVQEIYNNIKDL